MTIKALLFDRDGTLTDFDRTWGPALAHTMWALADHDPVKAARIAEVSMFDLAGERFMGPSVLKTQAPADYAPMWAKAVGSVCSDAFLQRVNLLLQEKCDVAVTAFPGVVETLHHIHASGLPIGIATNGTEASARRQMEVLKVDHLFTFWAGYDSGFGRKPEPGQLRAFANHVGLAPEEIAMVGDSFHDLHAAAAAGFIKVAVPTGAVGANELSDHADIMLSAFSDILSVLDLRP